MGIDVEADGKPTDLWLPHPGWTIGPACEDEHRKAGATHAIRSHCRYYNIGLERGPWPQICAVLLSLFASTNVKRVWYVGDDSSLCEGVAPLTRADVHRISEHHMVHQRAYRDRLR